MSKRIRLQDFMGAEDPDMNSLFSDNEDSHHNIAEILKKVINNELSERQKQLIILYYFKNMNMVSIAKMMNISPASVSKTLKRARKNIIEYIKYYF